MLAVSRPRLWISAATARLERLRSKKDYGHLAEIVDHSPEGLVSLDPELRVSYANAALRTMWGHDPSLMVGKPLSDILEESHAEELTSRLSQAVATWRSAPLVFDTTIRRRDGVVRDCELVAAGVPGAHGVTSLVVTLRDVTERRRLERELKRGALRDDLTGLAHSALFYDRLVHALTARSQRPETHVALILFDLDEFRQVNRTLGHVAGDRLLVGVGDRLQRCARAADTVARIGGDRFAILLEGNATLPEAIRMAQRMLQVLSFPIEADRIELSVRASAGIALAEETTGAEELVRNADAAMRDAKSSQTGGYEVFDPGLRS